MAGSLLRPPLILKPLNKKYSSSSSSNSVSSFHNKSIIKKYQHNQQQHYKQNLLHLKGKYNSNNNSHRSLQGYPVQLKHLKYCRQSLLFKELLLLLFSATNDSCWSAIEYKNNCNNLPTATIIPTTQVTILKNVHQKQQQQLQLLQKQQQQPQLQFYKKLFASTNKFRKNSLNRKKVQLQLQQQQQHLQLKTKQFKDKLFYSENQLLAEKSF